MYCDLFSSESKYIDVDDVHLRCLQRVIISAFQNATFFQL